MTAEPLDHSGSHDELPLTEARAHLTELANQAAYTGHAVYITRHGKRVAALVPAEVLEDIEAAEDRIDAEELERVKAAGSTPVDWEDAKKELAL